jgi:triphosphatase
VQELEAKYLMAPGADPDRVLRRLQESLAWAGFRIQPAGRQPHRDIYLDTPDQQLRRAGWSLRERDGDNRRVLTLKEINRARAGIFDRRELEQVLDSPADTVQRPAAGAVRQRLCELLAPGAEVAPLFRIDTVRDLYRLSHPDHSGALLELALDRSRIDQDGQQHNEFSELEIQFQQDSHQLLADALAVAELEPGLLSARLSKYERGLITARCAGTGHGADPMRAPDRTASALEVASDHLKRQLAQIRLFEPYAWEGVHTEGVHQMRVASRRASAALRAFAAVLPPAEAERVAEGLSRLTAALGAVRDMDVHLAHLPDYRSLLEPSQQERLQGYEQRLLKLHGVARCNLLKVLENGSYRALVDDYRALLVATARAANGSPLRLAEVAPAVVGAAVKKVHRRGRAITGAHPSPVELHRLRLAAKCLRYQLECMQGAYDGIFVPALETLKSLQDRLGRYQDAYLAREHLEAYRRGYADGKRERRLIGELVLFEKLRARQEREPLQGDWQRFQEASAGLAQRL